MYSEWSPSQDEAQDWKEQNDIYAYPPLTVSKLIQQQLGLKNEEQNVGPFTHELTCNH